MKLRRVSVVAFAVAASVPFAAAPASAHGSCGPVAFEPVVDEIDRIYGPGGILCSQVEYEFAMTICLQHSPVDVAALYTPAACSSYTYDDPAFGIQYFGASAMKLCPYPAGYWRTQVTGTVGTTDHAVSGVSNPVLVASTCPV